jgi:hypothetical protein
MGVDIITIHICKYSLSKKMEWNNFLSGSNNDVFLFHRDYMEYHSNRFVDSSFMVYDDEHLVALLPANIDSDRLISHGGLTFGGFITGSCMTAAMMLNIMKEFVNHLRGENIIKIIYKKIPAIYHSSPSDEDLYALFRIGARLIRRDVSSTLYCKRPIPFQKNRIRNIKKAKSAGIVVKESPDLAAFWEILQLNLARKHNKEPVHSLQEMLYLQKSFPQNIRLFASYKDSTMLAGALIYESPNVAHAQYIARNVDSKVPGSLDFLFSYLIAMYSSSKRYFDFGISTEDNGLYLNEALVFFKEGFGARSIVYDTYEVDINEAIKNKY